MKVYFLGSNIPFQGIPIIRQAQKLLQGEKDIELEIHDGKPWLPFAEHIARMKQADIVLGIFGTTRKTQMVIPNKVYEALAVGRPVITADTPAIHELLGEDSALFIPAGNPRALADAILRLMGDSNLRERLATNGRAIFTKQAKPKELVAGLIKDVLLP